jgi:hypothetical protein
MSNNIANGDFEQDNVNSWYSYQCPASWKCTIFNTGGVVVISYNAYVWNPPRNPNPTSGTNTNFVGLQVVGTSIEQSILVGSSNVMFSVSFDAAVRIYRYNTPTLTVYCTNDTSTINAIR